MVLYIYAGTLFLSAFILFLVQPIIGKMILPKLGGTPQVWNTCMVFFQMVLLAGYAYTHTASTRLAPRRQLSVHGLLLLLPLIVLFMFGQPFDVEWWNAPPGVNPIPRTLLLLVTIVGLPFFVVSTTAPLLQRWFVYTGHPAARDPYFLYGASNLGSLLALVLYPILVEPWLTRASQAWLWAGLYIAFIACVMACAYLVWGPTGRYEPSSEPAKPSDNPQTAPGASSTAIAAGSPAAAGKETAFKKGPSPKAGVGSLTSGELQDVESISTWRRVRWIALAAVPSSLMLGVTTHATTDLSPIPLFWVVPLALYLLSFVCVFAKWPVVWTDKPHTFVLYTQPIAIALMLFMAWTGGGHWMVPIFFDVLGFTLTALACHGELAKDRPSTKHLTEFYLMMSVGGMIGGMFNGLVSPIIPVPYVWEYSAAIIASCLVRPMMRDTGWLDDFIAGMIESQPALAPTPAKGKAPARHAPVVSVQKAGASPALSRNLDFILPLGIVAMVLLLGLIFGGALRNRADESSYGFYMFMLYGLPLMVACTFLSRPIRLTLSVAIIVIFHGLMVGDSYMYGDRTYFGIIRVRAQPADGLGYPGQTYHSLMHGNIDHGMNFRKPGQQGPLTLADYKDVDPKERGWGGKDDNSRLASTYYHRFGPPGIVMERWNWAQTIETEARGKENTYWHWNQNTWHADARMPGSLIGLALGDGSLGAVLPASPLCHAFSEPPIATVGLGTGTMASYARPYMSCHFYEIDNHIKKLSLPDYRSPEHPTFLSWWWSEPNDLPRSKIYFCYLMDAIMRGADVQVYLGDAYQRMKMDYYNVNDPAAAKGKELPAGGPMNYYRMMVVDAFSSDAIPAHLLTTEAFTMYFDRLTEDGILCVHTSNRYVDLPKVVVAVASKLGYVAKRGHDVSPFKGEGRTEHYTSEWVMVARHSKYLTPYLRDPAVNTKSGQRTYRQAMQDYVRRQEKKGIAARAENYWTDVDINERYVWTLDYYNLFNVLRLGGRRDDD